MQAFPSFVPDVPADDWNLEPGMSLRQWCAGKAPSPPPAMLASMERAAFQQAPKDDEGTASGKKAQELFAHLLSKWAFRYADSMIRESAKAEGAGDE